MAAKGIEMALALAVILMTWHGAWAQSQVGCTSAFMKLSPCLKSVNGTSSKPSATTKPSPPSASCCSSLTGVMQSQPECVCLLVNGGGAMAGFAMTQAMAITLPAACNIQNPNVTQCDTPVASPPSAPVGITPPSNSITPSVSSSNDTPADTTPSDTTGGGSKLFPWMNHGSDAVTIKSSLPITVFLLFIVSFRLSS